MANATGRRNDYEKYAQRAGNWQNVFKEDYESMGFTDFPQPRNQNGTWAFQNATLCSPINNLDGCYLSEDGHETYEGSPWLYQFYVPGDMAALIKKLGGGKSFVKRLDKLHDSGVLWVGDEQAFLTTFQYHYAGRPGLSSQRAHSYIPRLYNDSINGLPGNDDSGSMSAFVFFSMLVSSAVGVRLQIYLTQNRESIRTQARAFTSSFRRSSRRSALQIQRLTNGPRYEISTSRQRTSTSNRQG